MKNKIEDLRNHMFEALERLADDDIMDNPELREKELKRSMAIAEVGKVIVEIAKAEVAFMRITDAPGTGFIPNSRQLGGGEK
jgi:hypothetical protein